mgnify:CR=1 FL=1
MIILENIRNLYLNCLQKIESVGNFSIYGVICNFNIYEGGIRI